MNKFRLYSPVTQFRTEITTTTGAQNMHTTTRGAMYKKTAQQKSMPKKRRKLETMQAISNCISQINGTSGKRQPWQQQNSAQQQADLSTAMLTTMSTKRGGTSVGAKFSKCQQQNFL